VTELLFDLGLGEHLAGVTEFCRYPPEARLVPRVGGYLDLNVERVVSIRPTVVFGLKESEVILRPLERLSVAVELLDHSSLAGIKASYALVGDRCGVGDRANKQLSALESRESAIRARCIKALQGRAARRVLVVVGRTRDGSAESGVYVSGSDGFYADIISLLGAVNVHKGRTVAVPTLSAEGIIKLAPDVIVDIVSVDDGIAAQQARGFWRRFSTVPAARDEKVVVVSDDFASIPGPRYILLAERLSRLLCED